LVVELRGRKNRCNEQTTPSAPYASLGLNMIDRFFRDLTRNEIRRGVFHDLEQLITAIGDSSTTKTGIENHLSGQRKPPTPRKSPLTHAPPHK
jgi:uncharacterized protein YcbK (DUF882 family)